MAKQSILGRVSALLRANINALLDQAEDPQLMLDQLVRDYTNNIAEAESAVAQTIGQLSLSLRSLADNNAELERAIASGEVQVPQNGDPRAERQMLLAVGSRPADTGSTYSVGADVSRFQRSTVPARSRENNNNAPAASGGSTPANPDGRPIGPVVRIARGNNVTLVPVGAR